jgi:hypothetical protein
LDAETVGQTAGGGIHHAFLEIPRRESSSGVHQVVASHTAATVAVQGMHPDTPAPWLAKGRARTPERVLPDAVPGAGRAAQNAAAAEVAAANNINSTAAVPSFMLDGIGAISAIGALQPSKSAQPLTPAPWGGQVVGGGAGGSIAASASARPKASASLAPHAGNIHNSIFEESAEAAVSPDMMAAAAMVANGGGTAGQGRPLAAMGARGVLNKEHGGPLSPLIEVASPPPVE